MIFSAPHVAFVVWSYAISFVVLAGLIGFYLWRARKLDRQIALFRDAPTTQASLQDASLQDASPQRSTSGTGQT